MFFSKQKYLYVLITSLLFSFTSMAMEEVKDATWWRQHQKQLKDNAKAGAAEDQYALGILYRDRGGEVLMKKPKKALRWFEAAANQGHEEATLDLICLCINENYEDNNDKVLKLISRMVKKKNATAQRILGWMYLNGKVVKRDVDEAITWFQFSANQGHVKTQYDLGTLFENGFSVRDLLGRQTVLLQPNQELSLQWYKMAADNGHPEAKKKLPTYRAPSYRAPTPKDIRTAQHQEKVAKNQAKKEERQKNAPQKRAAAEAEAELRKSQQNQREKQIEEVQKSTADKIADQGKDEEAIPQTDLQEKEKESVETSQGEADSLQEGQ